MRPDEQLHTCTLCGRGCRYARSVCSTCRTGTGLAFMPRRTGWVDDYYPVAVRRGWSIEDVAAGHAAYVRGLRDVLTVARESEYQRRARKKRRAAS